MFCISKRFAESLSRYKQSNFPFEKKSHIGAAVNRPDEVLEISLGTRSSSRKIINPFTCFYYLDSTSHCINTARLLLHSYRKLYTKIIPQPLTLSNHPTRQLSQRPPANPHPKPHKLLLHNKLPLSIAAPPRIQHTQAECLLSGSQPPYSIRSSSGNTTTTTIDKFSIILAVLHHHY